MSVQYAVITGDAFHIGDIEVTVGYVLIFAARHVESLVINGQYGCLIRENKCTIEDVVAYDIVLTIGSNFDVTFFAVAGNRSFFQVCTFGRKIERLNIHHFVSRSRNAVVQNNFVTSRNCAGNFVCTSDLDPALSCSRRKGFVTLVGFFGAQQSIIGVDSQHFQTFLNRAAFHESNFILSGSCIVMHLFFDTFVEKVDFLNNFNCAVCLREFNFLAPYVSVCVKIRDVDILGITGEFIAVGF